MKFSKVKQFFKSKKVVRVGACVLAAIIVAGGTGAYHVYGQKAAAVQDSTQKTTDESENDTDKEENILKQVLKSQTDGEETTVDKEETVYVVADPDGTPNEVIVSDWLKNHSGAATYHIRQGLMSSVNESLKNEKSQRSSNIRGCQ